MKKIAYLLLTEILCLVNLNVRASEVHFSEIDKFIITQIDSAKKSVQVCVFIYEWQPIADALIRASKRGVDVELLTDYRSVNRINRGGQRHGSTTRYTAENGVRTYVWNRVSENAIMHNKFVIIDDAILLLGSYNFQEGATLRNRENFCLISDEVLLKKFSEQYDIIKSESEIYIPQEDNIQENTIVPTSSSWKRHRKTIGRIVLVCSLLLNVIFLLSLLIRRYK